MAGMGGRGLEALVRGRMERMGREEKEGRIGLKPWFFPETLVEKLISGD
jgi:hypothetical protein